MLVIFYLLFTHKVKNNKILIVAAILEIIVVAVLYIAYHTNKLYYEPYWYIHSEGMYSRKAARSLAPEIHFDFWNYIGKNGRRRIGQGTVSCILATLTPEMAKI